MLSRLFRRRAREAQRSRRRTRREGELQSRLAGRRTRTRLVPATNSPTVRSFVCLAPSGNTPRPSLR
jgi:hypothetical protein